MKNKMKNKMKNAKKNQKKTGKASMHEKTKINVTFLCPMD
jgi:hypothetical protein